MKIIDNLHAFLWTSPAANNCNTYLINGDKKILFDPGHYHLFDYVNKNLKFLSLSPEDMDLVIITHAHPDHAEGVKIFQNTESMVAVGRLEIDLFRRLISRTTESGKSDSTAAILLQEGDFHVGNLSFQILHTPGHSPGSICVYWPEKKVLFTGDVVFNQGVGRTDLAGGDGQLLKKSIVRLAALDVEYLLPGHGDIVAGSENVKRNFSDIERMWFAYL